MEAIKTGKRCSCCRHFKPYSEFTRNRTRGDGYFAYCKNCKRDRENRRNSVLSEEEYQQLFEKQQGKCAICGQSQSKRPKGTFRTLVADHDHKTGKPRELLCHFCNMKLSVFEDEEFTSLAFAYLARHK